MTYGGNSLFLLTNYPLSTSNKSDNSIPAKFEKIFQLGSCTLLATNKVMMQDNVFLISDSPNRQLFEIIRRKHSIIDVEIFNCDNRFLCLQYKNRKITILTDRFGLIPLFVGCNENFFVILSELDTVLLKTLGFSTSDLSLLDPATYITLDPILNQVHTHQKPILKISLIKKNSELIIQDLVTLIERIVIQSVEGENRVAVLFSGGVDSTTLCYILKKSRINFQAYVVGRKDSHDVQNAQEVARDLDFPLQVVTIDYLITEKYLHEIERIIQTRLFKLTTTAVPPVVTMSVAIVYFFGIQKAVSDGYKVILTALGTEELFAGFEHRDKTRSLEDLILERTFTIHQRDLYRDYRLASHFNVRFIIPFLNLTLAKFALSIPVHLKVKHGVKKYIWRKTALAMGIPEEWAFRKNKATQYGSKTNRILDKITQKNGFKHKRELLKHIFAEVEANSRLDIDIRSKGI